MRIRPNQADVRRDYKRKHALENDSWIFAVITGATAIESPNDKYMWEYTIAEAEFTQTAGSYPVIQARTGGITGTAFSVSELGNTTNTFSYGVGLNGVAQFTAVPPTIFPVKIPNGVPVLCMPWRKTDGTFIYLIVNTQAISGTCE
jgi:hypothetical protein